MFCTNNIPLQYGGKIMKTNKQKLGNCGEDLACEYLVKKGYHIKKRNFRFGRGELDIIGTYKNTLVIAEVKSIRKNGYGLGGERVSIKKQKEIIRATYGYLSLYPVEDNMGVRFDVIVIDFRSYPAGVVHYEGAFWQRG
jgi:putative endonuclease